MDTLLIFTGSYPYSATGERTFLEQELKVLARYFGKIFLIPQLAKGDLDDVRTPGIAVNTGYSRFVQSRVRRALWAPLTLFDLRLWREIVAHREMFFRHPAALARAARYNVHARLTERWIRSFARDHADQLGRWLCYTWWFDATTLGLSSYRLKAGVPVITRAHGVDLYEGRHDPPYIPFRDRALDQISGMFSASHAGARHVVHRYPAYRDKIEVSLLGVDAAPHQSVPSSDGVFRVVSCSFIVPVKRLDLLIRCLERLGRERADVTFDWTHIGDGPKEPLEDLARAVLPANIRWRFLPYPGRDGLFAYYHAQPVDVFVNTSASEGTPVAVMEAISAGIPVIATAVGGNPEIIGPENGVLLTANPDPVEFSAVVGSLLDDRARLDRLRAGSRAKWEREYSATANYSAFAEMITQKTRTAA
ncbi:MAG TPA: glycosyltransferase [Gemmatimonadaceae bacterium]|nr:glycosyltransferase [Gemmatimonadaceae bacterium]